MRRQHAEHQIEEVGRDLRAMMPWLNPVQQDAESSASKVSK
jgi:ketol-acid reductoisomerase